MKKYKYIMIGMFDGTDGDSYDIQIPSPFIRDTEKEAIKDGRLGYRFLLVGTVPCLVCFTKENFEGYTNEDGYKGLKAWIEGDEVDVYDFDKFQNVGGKIRRFKDSSEEKVVIDDNDFEETRKTFIDIFPNMQSEKLYYVDSHGYKISEIQ